MKTPSKETIIKLAGILVEEGFTVIDALLAVYGLYGLSALHPTNSIPPRDYQEAKEELNRRHSWRFEAA